MSKIKDFLKSPLGTALCAAAACLLAVVLVWLAAVRPNNDKSLSERISDDYSQYSAELDEANGAAQTFDTDNDLLAMAFVFGTSNGQPTGELHLELADADTGEVLARSTGDMANIVAGQYTGMGLDTPVTGSAGRRYRMTLKPEYTGSGRLTVGCSNGAVLWNDTFTVNGEAVDGTLALLVTYKQIGGFLTRFFLLVGLLASVVVFLGIYFAMRGRMPLHRLVFVLVLCFGMLYSFVLPPYAAPDEKYHINQSFTLACKWANMLSPDEWRMGNVPLDMTYRREHDFDPLLQNETTTVFSWQELSENLFTTTPDSFDSHTALEELQTDRNPTLYLFSAAAVFLAYVFHLGFVPALMLGRTANLIVFALLAALAVKAAPFGRRVFAAAALLPMTLHLAASFSRDSLLLGLAFAFTALCMQAIFGCKDGTVLPEELFSEHIDPNGLEFFLRDPVAPEPAPEKPATPDPDANKHAFEVFLDCIAMDDGLVQYLIDVLKRMDRKEFFKLSQITTKLDLDPEEFLYWLSHRELYAGEEEQACAAMMDHALLRLAEEGRLDVVAALLSGDQKTFETFRCEAPELVHAPVATYDWYARNYLDRDYPIRLIMRLNGVKFPN